MVKRDFKGVWIPAEVWLSTELSLVEKCFLVEIDSLDNKDHCYASNKHFAEFFNLSKARCSQIISSLINKGYVEAEYQKKGGEIEKRVLKILKGCSKNPKRGYLENAKENNTITNNTNNNIPLLEDVIEFFRSNGYSEEIAEKAYLYYSENNWCDSRGKKVRNWKQKMRGNWFRDQYKASNSSAEDLFKQYK
jgi:hypothetical protein